MIGPRFKEERERIGLTQESLGVAVSAGRRTVVDWEKGVSSPTAVQLAVLAGLGVDILYVVTGARLGAPHRLTPEETALVDNFRHSPPEARKAIKTTSDLLAKRHHPDGDAQCG